MSALPLYDSKLLLKQVAEGNERAFRRVYDHYSNRIYNYAFKIIQSEVLAEEILQDVFVKAWLNRATLPDIQHFEGWLYTIVRNNTFNTLKREAHRGRFSAAPGVGDDVAADGFTAEERLYLKEYEQQLHKVVAQLPVQQKRVFILSKEEGLKRDEIAGKLQISPETVKSHLAEAMRFIRSRMSDEHILLFLLYTGAFIVSK